MRQYQHLTSFYLEINSISIWIFRWTEKLWDGRVTDGHVLGLFLLWRGGGQLERINVISIHKQTGHMPPPNTLSGQTKLCIEQALPVKTRPSWDLGSWLVGQFACSWYCMYYVSYSWYRMYYVRYSWYCMYMSPPPHTPLSNFRQMEIDCKEDQIKYIVYIVNCQFRNFLETCKTCILTCQSLLR